MFSIRAARTADLERLHDLMHELHHEHHIQAPDSFKTADEIDQEKSIARYLDDPECLVFVAVEHETIVGFITGHFCELISTVSKPVQMGSVDELYICPEFRRNHLANRLYQTIEQRFEEYGVQHVFVEVWHFNQNARQFYAEVGFEHHIHWLRKVISK